jgi:hypothetical protein
MKRNFYLTLILAISILPLAAQPTLTTADLPVPGLAFTLIQDSAYTAAIPAGGANVTWDFSGLRNLVTDTIGFGAAAGTPYAAYFPTSNMASQADNMTDWTYTTSNSSGFYLDGVANPSTVLRFNPPSLFAPVPFTYNQTRTNIARVVQDTVIVDTSGTSRNIRFILHQQSNFLADGYGNLILPNGTFNNILRMKITELTYDSLLVEFAPGVWLTLSSSVSQSTFYRYFEAGSPSSYILGIEADSLGNTSVSSEYRGQWLLLNAPALASQSKIIAFPNPADAYLQLEGELFRPGTLLRLLDASGRIVREEVMTGVDKTSLPVRELSPGLYQLLILSENETRAVRVVIRH